MAAENLVARKKRALAITRRLLKKYPDPHTALHHSTPLDLLAATILSAQCTDARVNLVTPALFAKYKTAAAYAAASPADLEKLIRTTGFFRQKTKSLIGMGKALVERFSGQVPLTIEELTTLPGVARKTANVVLGEAFRVAVGVVVDRHVMRVAGPLRLKLTAATAPEKIEQDLMKLLPPKHWIDFGMMVVLHGRETCTAQRPRCSQCPLDKLCPSARKTPGWR